MHANPPGTRSRKLDLRERVLEGIEPLIILICVGAMVGLLALAFVPMPYGDFELSGWVLAVGSFFNEPTGRFALAFGSLLGTLAGLCALGAMRWCARREARMSACAPDRRLPDAGLADQAVEVRALDRGERSLARIEPLVVTTYAGLVFA